MNKWIKNTGIEPDTNGRKINVLLDDGQVVYNNKYGWDWRLTCMRPIIEWRFSGEENEMEEFKQGDMIQVRNKFSIYWDKRKYIGYDQQSSLYVCINDKSVSGYEGFDEARTIPDIELVEYDFDTFPRGIVYIKRKELSKDKPCVSMVINIDWQEIETNDQYISYSDLDEYLISTDLCKTWHECGVRENTND